VVVWSKEEKQHFGPDLFPICECWIQVFAVPMTCPRWMIPPGSITFFLFTGDFQFRHSKNSFSFFDVLLSLSLSQMNF